MSSLVSVALEGLAEAEVVMLAELAMFFMATLVALGPNMFGRSNFAGVLVLTGGTWCWNWCACWN